MRADPLRVAFFTDTYHEVNGVALTSRKLADFAQRRGLPLFSFHAGPADAIRREGLGVTFEMKRGWAEIPLAADLTVDPFLVRRRESVYNELRKFQPDLIHVTATGDCCAIGMLAARALRVPMAASWHTNIHEFGAWRLKRRLGLLPQNWRDGVGNFFERKILAGALKFYGAAEIIFAPNPELIRMLAEGTGKPVFLMRRGVNTQLFSPEKRSRTDDTFQLGFVGRLNPEKNLRFLAQLERALLSRGLTNYRFVIVGPGSEEEWLRHNLKQATFPGVVKGEELARTYANFDLFVFPSYTDTYGNVIQESLAAGVPPVVTSGGGPKYIIEDGVTGLASRDGDHFVANVIALMENPGRLSEMRRAARQAALNFSWDAVFEQLYRDYATVLSRPLNHGGEPHPRNDLP